MSYLALVVWLSALSLIFFKLPAFRLLTSIALGLSYSLWGIITHWRDKTLFLPIVLEYLTIGLLATSVLIFISLRA